MVRIGNSELDIFPVGLGTNSFGVATDTDASATILDAFVAAGGNHLDTADMYSYWAPGNSGGESETIIGEWIKSRGSRDKVIIGTKVGGLPGLTGLAPETLTTGVDASLKRLQTDYIDLYYAHYDDESQTIADIATNFDNLVKAGKVRYVAPSNFSPARITEWVEFAQANNLAVPVAVQPQYSLVARQNYEQNYAAVAEQHNLGVLTYSSLGSGFLSGKYRTPADLEGAGRGGAVEKYLNDDGLRVITAIESVASAHNAAFATVALAWLLAKPTVTAPLASATSVEQLAELMAAADLKLSAEDVATLDTASEAFAYSVR